jgi:hypothetical protein
MCKAKPPASDQSLIFKQTGGVDDTLNMFFLFVDKIISREGQWRKTDMNAIL